MSKTTTVISVVAAAGTAALLGAAAVRRVRSAKRRAISRQTASGRKRFPRPLRPELAELPRHVVLPLAFWDAAAELDSEDDLPPPAHALGTIDDAYDSFDLEDASATWLARATQSSDPNATSDVDDPAEIAADSMSMVSEASRLAAGADPSGFEDSPPASQPG
jgi:hypothetical protein